MIDKRYVESRIGDIGIRRKTMASISNTLKGLPKEYADSVIDTLKATYIDQRTKISV